MPSKRYNHASVQVDNNVYLIGGLDGGNSLKSVHRINVDDATPSWESIQDMSEKRMNCAAALHENTIFVFGGQAGRNFRNNTLSSIKYFETTANEGWMRVENGMETARPRRFH